ncbi:MAG TPA: ribosome-associated translation inhibitor RaiA [Vicinamibacteria bacterium]|jgi:putative sigma-54 modulation protein|nr:ribosome-associated translation inhibitor RaiA [Vicinamibacteria bacterium]
MRVVFTGRHMDVHDSVRRLGDRKVRKLARILRGITDVHVILTADKRRVSAEVNVHSPHLDLAATEQSDDAAVALSAVMDKLTRQAERHVGKMRVRKGGGRRPTSVRTTPPVVSAPREERGPRVIRNRRFAVKPMTIEEAALEVGASADGVLVFRDASTERVNVLYRRKDGNLGLIEPEA